jgi:hypothetical protein
MGPKEGEITHMGREVLLGSQIYLTLLLITLSSRNMSIMPWLLNRRIP